MPLATTALLPVLLPVLLALGACGSGSGDVSTPPEDDMPPGSTEPAAPVEEPAAPAEPDEPAVQSPDAPEPLSEIVAELLQPEDLDTPPVELPAAPDDVVARVDVVDIDGVYPYRPDGRHADVLADCALIEDFRDACPLSTLPFIVQENPTPAIGDVMDRVLVTHDWMGERFETLLESRSAELLPLFGSVTSIVIGSTVRPSNYWTGTGGIQLDPAGLWLTVEEKANVSIEEDFRAPFRRLLGFRDFWDIHVAGRSIFGRFGLEDRSERTLRDIELPTMSLMFHELAHAADFLPPGTSSLLDSELIPAAALEQLFTEWLSPSLDERLPLNSELLITLGQVRFRGETPTEEQSAVSGTVAGAEMAADGATHFYSYSTIREDFANLFETLQMKRLFDADVHLAYTVQPEDPENFSCADLQVEWGVLNRLGDPSVLERARDVTESIYGPDPTLDVFVAAQQGTEIPMEVGVDFCTNLSRAAPAAAATRSRTATFTLDRLRSSTTHPTHAERHAIADPRRSLR